MRISRFFIHTYNKATNAPRAVKQRIYFIKAWVLCTATLQSVSTHNMQQSHNAQADSSFWSTQKWNRRYTNRQTAGRPLSFGLQSVYWMRSTSEHTASNDRTVWRTRPWQVFGSSRGIREEISRNLSGGAEEESRWMSRIDPFTARTQAGAPALGPVCSVLWSMEQAECLTLYRR